MQASVVCQHFQTTSPLKPRSRFFSYFTYSIYRLEERIIVFLFNRLRTLVAMATYSSHRLIMGKRKIVFSVSMRIFGIFFNLQKCLLSSRLHFIRRLSKSLNLIGCQSKQEKIFSETIRWMKLILFIHVYDIINCLFCFTKSSQKLRDG